MRPDYRFELMFEAFDNKFDKDTNKDGVLIMLFAENQLMWKEMQQKI